MNSTYPEGKKRVVVQRVRPDIDCGRYPIKRAVGQPIKVSADVFVDGHDAISASVRYRKAGEDRWHDAPMAHAGNDRWEASFRVDQIGEWEYTVTGWADRFLTWQRDLRKRQAAGQDLSVELQIGRALVEEAIGRADKAGAELLRHWEQRIDDASDPDTKVELMLNDGLTEAIRSFPDPDFVQTYPRTLKVWVDRQRAEFSTWYELFPRSCGEGLAHGTFKDVVKRLPAIQEMGFDVLYLPPIHPIGHVKRKGKNNAPTAEDGDVGSPWAIGSKDGGHTAIHPELGTLKDFKALVKAAEDHGIELAMDIAFQCAPDHPWVKAHPQWFKWRPDGTVQYAENPPKKYEDILPIHFETDDWQNLWEALRDVVAYWVEQGVKIFRVDNPHTKPFAFWEWMIAEIKRRDPDVLFLSEAFTRPKVMYKLAKAGFTQGYTYFTWRNTKEELTKYLEDLTRTEIGEVFRPNFWPNTPDILPEALQYHGRKNAVTRLILAATLSGNYGMYGPAFELVENAPTKPGKEEYLNSEKYEIKDWDLDRPGHIRELIKWVNRIRHDNAALQQTRNLQMLTISNDHLIAYAKATDDNENVIVVVVNLDHDHRHSGWLHLPLVDYDIDTERPYMVHDLLSNDRYTWQGDTNYIELDPSAMPAHIFRVQRRMRREDDFDYFM